MQLIKLNGLANYTFVNRNYIIWNWDFWHRFAYIVVTANQKSPNHDESIVHHLIYLQCCRKSITINITILQLYKCMDQDDVTIRASIVTFIVSKCLDQILNRETANEIMNWKKCFFHICFFFLKPYYSHWPIRIIGLDRVRHKLLNPPVNGNVTLY